jgi:hypothetical protein
VTFDYVRVKSGRNGRSWQHRSEALLEGVGFRLEKGHRGRVTPGGRRGLLHVADKSCGLGGGNPLREEVTLSVLAPQTARMFGLLLGLDPLGDNIEAKALSERDDGSHDLNSMCPKCADKAQFLIRSMCTRCADKA